MRFIKKNIFMIVFFLFVAPLAFYIGYNTIYKPYAGDIASLFKMDKSDSKKSGQPTKAPIKEKKDSDRILKNNKDGEDFPKITKEMIDPEPSASAETAKNDKLPLGETDIFANLDSDIKNSDTPQSDNKTDTKTDPNIASDNIFQDILNDNQTSPQIQKDFNIDLPEDKNNNKKQGNNMSSEAKNENKKSENIQADLAPAPSESLLDEKAVSEVTKDLENKNENLASKSVENILDEKEILDVNKHLENKNIESVPPVVGENIIGDIGIVKMNQQLEEKAKGKILQPSDNILGEEAAIDLGGQENKPESSKTDTNIVPKADENVLGEISEKNDTVAPVGQQSEAQKKALEELEITEDLFPMSPSPEFQGIIPSPPDDTSLVQDTLSDKNNVKNIAGNKQNTTEKQPHKSQDKTKFQPIKLSSAECAYEHEIDSKNMQETFRLMISVKQDEKPLTMEVTRELDLLEYVTMTTDDIDGYPDSFTQLSVFCNRMTVRKILNEDYPNISSPVSSSAISSP